MSKKGELLVIIYGGAIKGQHCLPVVINESEKDEKITEFKEQYKDDVTIKICPVKDGQKQLQKIKEEMGENMNGRWITQGIKKVLDVVKKTAGIAEREIETIAEKKKSTGRKKKSDDEKKPAKPKGRGKKQADSDNESGDDSEKETKVKPKGKKAKDADEESEKPKGKSKGKKSKDESESEKDDDSEKETDKEDEKKSDDDSDKESDKDEEDDE